MVPLPMAGAVLTRTGWFGSQEAIGLLPLAPAPCGQGLVVTNRPPGGRESCQPAWWIMV